MRVLEHGGEPAKELVCTRIMSHNDSVVGKPTGNHETITVAWVRMIVEFVHRRMGLPREDQSRFKFQELGARDYLLRHGPRDLLFSDPARGNFVAPDLLPMP